MKSIKWFVEYSIMRSIYEKNLHIQQLFTFNLVKNVDPNTINTIDSALVQARFIIFSHYPLMVSLADCYRLLATSHRPSSRTERLILQILGGPCRLPSAIDLQDLPFVELSCPHWCYPLGGSYQVTGQCEAILSFPFSQMPENS